MDAEKKIALRVSLPLVVKSLCSTSARRTTERKVAGVKITNRTCHFVPFLSDKLTTAPLVLF